MNQSFNQDDIDNMLDDIEDFQLEDDMNQVDHSTGINPNFCIDCEGSGRTTDGQGQLWLCTTCNGYGSQSARAYGEKHPDKIKPASVPVSPYAADWSDIKPELWSGVLYSVEADKGFR